MIDVERLKHDAEYWDSQDPSGGEATYYDPEDDEHDGVAWMKNEGNGWEAWHKGKPGWSGPFDSDDDWRDSGSLIPRPTRKQWSGPEDGLPPVGGIFRYFEDPKFASCYPFTDWVSDDELEVIAHKRVDGKLIPVVFNIRHETATAVMPSCLLPLRTEKERVVEAVMKHMPYPSSPSTRVDLGAAYDAGFLMMPENSHD